MKYQELKSESERIELTNLGRIKKSVIAWAMIFVCFSITASATDYVVDKGVSTVKWEAKKVTGKHNGTCRADCNHL